MQQDEIMLSSASGDTTKFSQYTFMSDELKKLSQEYCLGRYSELAKDLEKFIIKNKAAIKQFKTEGLKTFGVANPSDELAVKLFIIKTRSINPATEIKTLCLRTRQAVLPETAQSIDRPPNKSLPQRRKARREMQPQITLIAQINKERCQDCYFLSGSWGGVRNFLSNIFAIIAAIVIKPITATPGIFSICKTCFIP